MIAGLQVWEFRLALLFRMVYLLFICECVSFSLINIATSHLFKTYIGYWTFGSYYQSDRTVSVSNFNIHIWLPVNPFSIVCLAKTNQIKRIPWVRLNMFTVNEKE